MKRIIISRHLTIAAVISSAVIIILSIFAISKPSIDTSEKLSIRQDQWYTGSIDTFAGSRFGYSSLSAAIIKKYGAAVNQLPWYPDDRNDGTVASDYMLIINSPERMWNKTEAAALESFLSRGGNVLIVTPTDFHLKNTSSFLKIIGVYYVPYTDKDESPISSHLTPYVRVARTGGHSPLSGSSVRANAWLREGITSRNPLFSSEVFRPLYVDTHGNPVILYARKKGWNKGSVIWMNAAFPGFNGEMKDPVFPESASDRLIDRYNNIPKLKTAKNKIEKAILESRGIEGSTIPEQGNQDKIRSGISLIESILDFPNTENKRIIFFEYLRTADDSTETLSLLSSGAFYVIVLAFILVFAGLIFFVREHNPVGLIREIRTIRTTDEIPIPEIDPPVTRQTKTRFAAQFIHIETSLKKFPKERFHVPKK